MIWTVLLVVLLHRVSGTGGVRDSAPTPDEATPQQSTATGRSRPKRRTKHRSRRKLITSAATVTRPERQSQGSPACPVGRQEPPEAPQEGPDAQLYELDAHAISPASEEPGTVTVQQGDVRRSTGAEWEQWRAAAETELNNSFFGMDAIAVATPADIAAAGTILPMKAVWTIKQGCLHTCRWGCLREFPRKGPLRTGLDRAGRHSFSDVGDPPGPAT